MKQVTHAGTLSALQLPTGVLSCDDHPDDDDDGGYLESAGHHTICMGGGYRWGAISNQEAGGGFGKWRIVEREKMQDELSNHIVGRHLSVGQILKRLFVRQY